MRPLSKKFYEVLDLTLTAHKKQNRRTFDNYAVHLVEVALLLISLGPDIPEYVIWAALLHDAIEDGHVTFDQIYNLCGLETAELVAEVTDDPRLSRPHQKEMQINSFADKSYWGKVLKLADRYSNACGHTGKDKRSKDYVEHTIRLLNAARKWGETVQEHGIKYKYVFILIDKIASEL